MKVFEFLDGMSNNYFGWCREDDDFMRQSKNSSIEWTIASKEFLGSNHTNTYREIHNPIKRPRDKRKCNHQYRHGTRMPGSGLKSTKSKILSVQQMAVDDAQYTMINAEVFCDIEVTPWCNCSVKVDKSKTFH